MGRRSKNTGLRYEREALAWWLKQSVPARRTAASGAQIGYSGDIEAQLDKSLNVEVKYSSVDRGMKVMRDYLKGADVLMARAPGEDWMFIMGSERMAYFLKCAKAFEGGNLDPNSERPTLVNTPPDDDNPDSEFPEREAPTLTESLPQTDELQPVITYGEEPEFFYPDGPHEGGWLQP